jgi:hypothetical protein
MTVDQKNSGLYQKFNVNRTDGRDAPGGDSLAIFPRGGNG